MRGPSKFGDTTQVTHPMKLACTTELRVCKPPPSLAAMRNIPLEPSLGLPPLSSSLKPSTGDGNSAQRLKIQPSGSRSGHLTAQGLLLSYVVPAPGKKKPKILISMLHMPQSLSGFISWKE